MKRIVAFIAFSLVHLSAAAYFPEWASNGTAGLYDVRFIATGDFNGDGTPDLLARGGDHYLYILLTGAGGKPGTPVRAYTGDYLGDFVTGDFDGDGALDVVASDISTNSLVFLRSNGDGTLQSVAMTAVPVAPSVLATGDFNGDKHLDVAFCSISGALLMVWRGDGNGHFAEASRAAIAPSYAIVSGDIDHDQRMDLLIGRAGGFDLFFGKGNGAFSTALPFTEKNASVQFALADLDDDGDAEIISSQQTANTISVIRNLGSRSFASPAVYEVKSSPGVTSSSPTDLIVADVNDDGHVDVVTSLTGEQLLATFAGVGDGTLRPPAYSITPAVSGAFRPAWLATADFNGDGQLDIAATSNGSGRIAFFSNAAGQVTMRIFPRHPVISAGQHATFDVRFDLDPNVPVDWGSPIPAPTGSVILKEGALALASGVPESTVVTVEAPSLKVGTHEVIAEFTGDDNYRVAASAVTAQKVVEEKTTTTLRSSASGEAQYGQEITLTGDAVSPITDGVIRAEFSRYIDGVRQQYTLTGPPVTWFVNYLPVGTHTFSVGYEGNSTQPPSMSNVLTQVIRKAQTTTRVNIGYPVEAGKSQSVVVDLQGLGTPQGWVTLYEGETMLVRVMMTSSSSVALPPFAAVGRHLIHAVFEGSENYEPSTSANAEVVVLAPRRRRTAPH